MGKIVVDLVSEVVGDRVVVLLVVLLMRLTYHSSIPHHPLRLPLHMSSHHYYPHLQALEATCLPSTTSPSPAALPLIDTMIDLVPNLGACPLRRPRALSAPTSPFEIAHAPTDHLVVYYKRPKRKTKPPSCGTH